MITDEKYAEMEEALERAGWFQMPYSGKWMDPFTGCGYYTEAAYKVMEQYQGVKVT